MKQPQILSKDEILEICRMDSVREAWGARDVGEMEEMFDDSMYALKFAFISGSPGYVGDLFILQGDVLTGDAPMILIPDADGRLAPAY